jgi:cysteine desulfurase
MNRDRQVYLDYAATTPLDDMVLTEMLPYFTEDFGNPSSVHSWGQRAEAAVESARETITLLLNAGEYQVVFTSGGTESDNLAIKGAARSIADQTGKRHLLISPVEHPAVSRSAEQLMKEGFELEWLPVDSFGFVDPAEVARRIRKDTALVSVVFGQNEIGTVNPVEDISRVCREKEVFFHTDAVQAAAHLPINLDKSSITSMALGAHKFYGPKGVGALIYQKDWKIGKLQNGGGQEFRMRAGTHNVPGIVGLAKAFEITRQEMEQSSNHESQLRDHLIGSVLEQISGSRLTGHPTKRLANHASFIFDKLSGNTLLMILDAEGFACSSGSACRSGNPQPSDILLAIGVDPESALGSLRVTIGRETKREDINALISFLPKAVASARRLAV